MTVSVEIAVKGQLGDLSFEASHDAVGSANNVFFLADKASHAGRRTLQSVVAGLPEDGRYGAVIRYFPLGTAVGADAAAVVDVVLDGIEEIEDASEPRIPAGYDVAMTESLAKLAERLRGGIDALDLTAINGTRGRTVTVVPALAQKVRSAIRPAEQAWGTIEGVVDLLSARGKSPSFGILERLERRHIRCLIAPDDLERAKAFFGLRVAVSGRMQLNRAYQVVRVDVESIDRLPDNHELPSIDTLFGSVPTFTGGVDPAAYVRAMRDDD